MFLGKCLRWSLLVWSKALCFGISGPTAWLATQLKAHSLWLGKQVFVKENEKSISVESRQYLRYAGEFFFFGKVTSYVCHCFFLACAKMSFKDLKKKKNILGNNFSKIQKLSSFSSSCQVALRITGKNLRSTPGSKIQKNPF